jgi:hypothetical protein
MSLREPAENARTVSSPGKRSIPGSACKARSPRCQSECAKRLAPVTTAKKNAVNVWASGIALGEVGAGNGSVCATRRPNPIC